MKICTCNNCGNIYEDMNWGDESIDYSDSLTLLVHIPELPIILLNDGDIAYGCPTCLTDGYLQDNINDFAGGQAKFVIDNYTVI